jgi:hypothetical protein
LVRADESAEVCDQGHCAELLGVNHLQRLEQRREAVVTKFQRLCVNTCQV